MQGFRDVCKGGLRRSRDGAMGCINEGNKMSAADSEDFLRNFLVTFKVTASISSCRKLKLFVRSFREVFHTAFPDHTALSWNPREFLPLWRETLLPLVILFLEFGLHLRVIFL